MAAKKGDPCKHCGKPVEQNQAHICNHCKNYPERRNDETIKLYNQFVLPRKKQWRLTH